MYYAENRGLKSGLRYFAKSTANQIARLIPFNSLLKLSGRNVLLPFYHAVSDETLPHISKLYKVRSSAQFEEDLDFLLKYYKPVDLSELSEITRGKKSDSTKGFMHLSFDDGLISCYNIIAPILQKKGIPATFFLNSAFIDNKALMFRYKASLCIESLNKIETGLKNDIMKKSRDFFQEHDLALSTYDETARLDELAIMLQLSFDDYLKEQKPYMSSEQIQSLLSQGFSIGSHSVDHPLYARINLEEQLNQTIQSQKFLEQKFGINYRVFAFPFTDYGVSMAFFNQLFEKENFNLSFGSAGLKTDDIKQNLQRFPMESQNIDSAKKMLSAEYLYYLLKIPFGRNNISR